MSVSDIFAIATAALAAVGGGGLIVFGLSSFLGKVWASRLMERERAEYSVELEQLRSQLTRETEAELEQLRRQLDLTVTSHLRETSDKLTVYRAGIDLIAELLGDFDRVSTEDPHDFPRSVERFDVFNRQRMKVYGYMAMIAPQAVMDAYDSLSDHLLLISHREVPYVWAEVRKLCLALLNEIRKDVALDKNPIEYRGSI